MYQIHEYLTPGVEIVSVDPNCAYNSPIYVSSDSQSTGTGSTATTTTTDDDDEDDDDDNQRIVYVFDDRANYRRQKPRQPLARRRKDNRQQPVQQLQQQQQQPKLKSPAANQRSQLPRRAKVRKSVQTATISRSTNSPNAAANGQLSVAGQCNTFVGRQQQAESSVAGPFGAPLPSLPIGCAHEETTTTTTAAESGDSSELWFMEQAAVHRQSNFDHLDLDENFDLAAYITDNDYATTIDHVEVLGGGGGGFGADNNNTRSSSSKPADIVGAIAAGLAASADALVNEVADNNNSSSNSGYVSKWLQTCAPGDESSSESLSLLTQPTTNSVRMLRVDMEECNAAVDVEMVELDDVELVATVADSIVESLPLMAESGVAPVAEPTMADVEAEFSVTPFNQEFVNEWESAITSNILCDAIAKPYFSIDKPEQPRKNPPNTCPPTENTQQNRPTAQTGRGRGKNISMFAPTTQSSPRSASTSSSSSSSASSAPSSSSSSDSSDEDVNVDAVTDHSCAEGVAPQEPSTARTLNGRQRNGAKMQPQPAATSAPTSATVTTTATATATSNGAPSWFNDVNDLSASDSDEEYAPNSQNSLSSSAPENISQKRVAIGQQTKAATVANKRQKTAAGSTVTGSRCRQSAPSTRSRTSGGRTATVVSGGSSRTKYRSKSIVSTDSSESDNEDAPSKPKASQVAGENQGMTSTAQTNCSQASTSVKANSTTYSQKSNCSSLSKATAAKPQRKRKLSLLSSASSTISSGSIVKPSKKVKMSEDVANQQQQHQQPQQQQQKTATRKLFLASSDNANTTTAANVDPTNASTLDEALHVLNNNNKTTSAKPKASKPRKPLNQRTQLMQKSMLLARSMRKPVVNQRTPLLEPLPADAALQIQAAANVGVRPPRSSLLRVRSMDTTETAPSAAPAASQLAAAPVDEPQLLVTADAIAQVAAAAQASAAQAARDQQNKKRLNLNEYLQRRRDNGDLVTSMPPTPPVQRPTVIAAAVAPPPIPLSFKIPKKETATAAAPAAASASHQPPPKPVLRDPSLEEIVVVSMACNTSVSLPCSTAPQRAIVPSAGSGPHTADTRMLLQQQQTTGDLLTNINDTFVRAQGQGNISACSSLLSSIQDVLIKKHLPLDAGSTGAATTASSTSTTGSTTTDNEPAEHGENKIIMFLPRNRPKPAMHSIQCQTDDVLQFAPLRCARRSRSRKHRDERRNRRQSSSEKRYGRTISEYESSNDSSSSSSTSSSIDGKSWSSRSASQSSHASRDRSSQSSRSHRGPSYNGSGSQASGCRYPRIPHQNQHQPQPFLGQPPQQPYNNAYRRNSNGNGGNASKPHQQQQNHLKRGAHQQHKKQYNNPNQRGEPMAEESFKRGREQSQQRGEKLRDGRDCPDEQWGPLRDGEKADGESEEDLGARRIIYVGRIDEYTNRHRLFQIFKSYGEIETTSIHYMLNGMKFGFVTFEKPEAAYKVMSENAKDPNLNVYDISFGGRRAFCRSRYRDLDGNLGRRNGRRHGPYDDVDGGSAEDCDGDVDAEPKKKVESESFADMLSIFSKIVKKKKEACDEANH